MATHDYVISNDSGAAVRADLNTALAAIVSNNSSATAPTTTYAYMWWADTASGYLKQRDSANAAWVTVKSLSGGQVVTLTGTETLTNKTLGDKLTFSDSSTQSSAQLGMKNRIINGGFILNQRGYVSGTALASGSYGHDRFKGGASGGTYTFTQGAQGVNTTITITAGSLIQVIEGCNVAEGGTYVLSWTGTAQGRLNGGTYGASGAVTITGWTAGTNLNVEFNTGTVGSIQLEKGSIATSFDYRPFGTELALCQRYYHQQGGFAYLQIGAFFWDGASNCSFNYSLPVSMRSVPTFSKSGAFHSVNGSPNIAAMTIDATASTTKVVNLFCVGGTGGSNGLSTYIRATNDVGAYFAFTAEL